MLFVLLARMRNEPEAVAARERLRPQQLETVRAMAERGTMRIGGALLDASHAPVGSMALLDFATRAELDAWIEAHPYKRNGVWGEIEAWPLLPAPAFAEKP
jgi:uncharacterized protein